MVGSLTSDDIKTWELFSHTGPGTDKVSHGSMKIYRELGEIEGKKRREVTVIEFIAPHEDSREKARLTASHYILGSKPFQITIPTLSEVKKIVRELEGLTKQNIISSRNLHSRYQTAYERQTTNTTPTTYTNGSSKKPPKE